MRIDFGLEGQALVVAGASRGIGARVAVACAEAGAASVGLLGRDGGALESVAREVAEAGAEPAPLACDVTSTAAVAAAFDQLGSVDALVYNAGANSPEPFVSVAERTFDRLLEVNLRGAFFTAQAAAKGMLASGRGGALVFVSSQMGRVGAADRTVYCASKHALEGLVKALGVELAADGIRAVSVAPTFVRTEMTASQLDDPEVGPQLLAQIPASRFASLDDVAAAVIYAASPAASMLTGTSIVVDGGWTAR